MILIRRLDKSVLAKFKCEFCGDIIVGLYNQFHRRKSCGCYSKGVGRPPIHGLSYSRLYECWSSMKERCLNKKKKNYNLWGGSNCL